MNTSYLHRLLYFPLSLHPRLLVTLLLLPISLLYLCGHYLHKFYACTLSTPKKLSVPIIAIGNVTLGGSGKTPITIKLAQMLINQGYSVAIITRGYARKSKGQIVVSDGTFIVTTPQEAGDEPYLMAKKLHAQAIIIADSNRYRGSLKAMSINHLDFIIFDDAAQHYSVKKDLEILVFQQHNPLGNALPIPAGPLRELPFLSSSSALKWVHGPSQDFTTNGIPFTVSSIYTCNSFEAVSKTPLIIPKKNLSSSRVFSFCALARPDSFLCFLTTLDINPIQHMNFPDHHWFTAQELKSMCQQAIIHNCQYLLTTEKDAVRIQSFAATLPLPIVQCKVEVEFISGEQELRNTIQSLKMH